MAQCRAKLAGKPKVLASLEAEWEEECGSCCQCDALSEDAGSDRETSEEENGWTQAEEPKTTASLSTAASTSTGPPVVDPWTLGDPWSPGKTETEEAKVSESLSDTIRRRQAEVKQKVEEILRKTPGVRGIIDIHADEPAGETPKAMEVPVPAAPPGMPRRKRQAWKGDRSVHIIGGPCCEKAECGTQTQVSLPHTARDVLWTASCLDPVADFEDDDLSVIIEACTNGSSVLDIDTIEVLHHDDDDDSDDAKHVGSKPENSESGADNPDEKFESSAITMMSMFLIMLANVSTNLGAMIENPGQHKASKASKQDKKRQKKKTQRQQRKKKMAWETDDEDGGEVPSATSRSSSTPSAAAPVAPRRLRNPGLTANELASLATCPGLTSIAGQAPREDRNIQEMRVQEVGDSLLENSDPAVDILPEHMRLLVNDFFLTNCGQGEDEFECPECWKHWDREPTILCTVTTFLRQAIISILSIFDEHILTHFFDTNTESCPHISMAVHSTHLFDRSRTIQNS